LCFGPASFSAFFNSVVTVYHYCISEAISASFYTCCKRNPNLNMLRFVIMQYKWFNLIYLFIL
jgi:hypothetical protein